MLISGTGGGVISGGCETACKRLRDASGLNGGDIGSMLFDLISLDFPGKGIDNMDYTSLV